MKGFRASFQGCTLKQKAQIAFLACAFALVGSLLPVFGAEFVEGEAIVTFKSSQSDSAAKQTLANHALTWTKHYDWLSRQRGKHLGLVRDKKRTTAELVA